MRSRLRVALCSLVLCSGLGCGTGTLSDEELGAGQEPAEDAGLRPAQTGLPDAAAGPRNAAREVPFEVEVVRVDHDRYRPFSGVLQTILSTDTFETIDGQPYRVQGSMFVDTQSPYHAVERSYGMGSGNISCDNHDGVGFVENTIPDRDDYAQHLGFVFMGDGLPTRCSWKFKVNNDPELRYQLAPGSFISVSTTSPDAYHIRSADLLESGASVRLTRGESARIVRVDDATLTGPTTFHGHLQMNGCRGIDPGTACLNGDWSVMVSAGAELKVYERHVDVTRGEDWCAVQRVFDQSRRFKSNTQPSSPGQHHATVFAQGHWTPTPGCGESARVEFYAKNTTSAADCQATKFGNCAIAVYSRHNLYVSFPESW